MILDDILAAARSPLGLLVLGAAGTLVVKFGKDAARNWLRSDDARERAAAAKASQVARDRLTAALLTPQKDDDAAALAEIRAADASVENAAKHGVTRQALLAAIEKLPDSLPALRR